MSINATIVESKPSSLHGHIELLKSNFGHINTKICTKFSKDDMIDVQLLIVEVASEADIKVLMQARETNIAIVVVLKNVELIKSLLKMNIAAFIDEDFDVDQIVRALERAINLVRMQSMGIWMDSILHLQQSKKSSTILIPVESGFEVIRINDIVKVEADRAYCNLFLIGGKRLTVSKPLSDIEAMLPKDLFFRSHVSHLININSVVSFRREDGGTVVLQDGSKVPVAKKRKEDLVALFMG